MLVENETMSLKYVLDEKILIQDWLIGFIAEEKVGKIEVKNL